MYSVLRTVLWKRYGKNKGWGGAMVGCQPGGFGLGLRNSTMDETLQLVAMPATNATTAGDILEQNFTAWLQ